MSAGDVDIDSIESSHLPQGSPVAAAQQQIGTRWLNSRIRSGNLLAAHQEVAKLGLLYPAGALTLEQVTDSVLNVARYDVFQLPLAILSGDAARVRKTMAGLEAEGEAIPLVLWVIAEELRMLMRIKAHVDAGRPFSTAARENRLWGPREKLVERALGRLSVAALESAWLRAVDIDRIAKGLDADAADSDPWLELAELALSLSTQKSSAR